MSSLNFNLTTEHELDDFLNAQKALEYKQRVIFYVNSIAQLLQYDFVKGIILKAPMFLFQENHEGMSLDREFYVVFKYAPPELNALKEQLCVKWPAPQKLEIPHNDWNENQKLKARFLQEQIELDKERELWNSWGGHKEQLKIINRSILFEQIDSLTKSFGWFGELFKGPYRHEIENIKEAWEFEEKDFSKLLKCIAGQEQKIGYPYVVGDKTQEFCKNEKMIHKDNFSLYQSLCFEPFKQEYEQDLFHQTIPLTEHAHKPIIKI